MKIVVFDLDETLGYFSQFSIFWECLFHLLQKGNHKLALKTKKNKLRQRLFCELLELYPEFLRPNILSVLSYLNHHRVTSKTCRTKSHCGKIIMYTNNNGSHEWVDNIVKFLETRLRTKLFDKLIKAYKINGVQIEKNRTTHGKTYEDLLKCTNVKETDEICFIDDVMHEGMKHQNVYYINVKPYTHDLPFETMIERFFNSNVREKWLRKKTLDLGGYNTTDNFREALMREIKGVNYVPKLKKLVDYKMDEIVSKYVLGHLHLFFYGKNARVKNKTRKLLS